MRGAAKTQALLPGATARLENLTLTPRPKTFYSSETFTAKNLVHVWVKINYYVKYNADHIVYRAGA
jgi:hypothetical protein